MPAICRNVVVSPDNGSSDCSDLGAKSEDVRLDECVESKACIVNETSEQSRDNPQPMSRDQRERNISQEVKLS